MSTAVQIIPFVLTIIALALCLKVGKYLEGLELGFIFNLLVVLFLGSIPLLVYIVSRCFCDGIL